METRTVEVTLLPDGRLDVPNTARYLGFSPKTLAMMRCDGSGPKFIRRGRIFYFREDLDAWLNSAGRHTSTAQAGSRRQSAEGNSVTTENRNQVAREPREPAREASNSVRNIAAHRAHGKNQTKARR